MDFMKSMRRERVARTGWLSRLALAFTLLIFGCTSPFQSMANDGVCNGRYYLYAFSSLISSVTVESSRVEG
jgi:hypothetical protein